ncbi:hypothetical protein R1flu_024690 [Riccia fluitans]|uniref:JmjC domain-containing protein n=1 Tax=Riccia fluitans TaxID=41844 RepID=A0ABD1XVL5_9MARC
MGNGDVVYLRGTEVNVQRFGEVIAGNLPAVLVGAVKLWPAISRWDPGRNGLEYMQRLAGTTQIQAITPKSESVFYGHIKGHERVSLTFGSFIDLIISESRVEQASTSPSSNLPTDIVDSYLAQETCSRAESLTTCSPSADQFGTSRKLHCMELYLAQVPIYNREQEGETALSPLMQDISTPLVLDGIEVWNINLWMSMKSSRSSTHYDPYHNVLCVVAGEKRVMLWSPSAAPYLYPLPVYGEASNHSGVDMIAPDYDIHPRFRMALQKAKIVTLQPGDALFIPEGWYHQVDNVGVTIAVNFWWPSQLSMSLGSAMDGYILRRVVSSLLDREKRRILKDKTESSSPPRETLLTESESILSSGGKYLSDSLKGKHSKVEDIQDLTVEEALHLRSLVATALGETNTLASADFRRPEDSNRLHQKQKLITGEDPVSEVFASLGALSLQRVLLVMATQFPRSLRILVMDMLSPAAAELLTMKFEELDGCLEASHQTEFYGKFYSVFENPEAVMAVLLEKKEAFAAEALRKVMLQFLGLSCCPVVA